MAIYSKDNPNYVPSEEQPKIDFCYTENGHLQIFIPFTSYSKEYIILQRERSRESGEYLYRIMLSANGQGKVYEVETKLDEDGRTVFDAVEQNGQTLLKLKDAETGSTLTAAIALTHENCEFAEQFLRMPELGKDITRSSTEIAGAPVEFVDVQSSKKTDRNAARNRIKSHVSNVAQTRPINTPETAPKEDEPPVITPKNMDPRPRTPRDLTRPEIFEYEAYVSGTGEHYGTIRNIMFPTPDGAFNIEIDMTNPGERLLVTHFKDEAGADHPYVIALGEDGKPRVTERFGHTFVSCFPFEELISAEAGTQPYVAMMEVPIHGPLLEYLRNMQVTRLDVDSNRIENPEALDSEILDRSRFYEDPDKRAMRPAEAKKEFEKLTEKLEDATEYKPFALRRTLSDHEVAQLYPYTENGEEKYLTIIQVAHTAEDGSPMPVTYDIVMADPANGGRATRHHLVMEDGAPHIESFGNSLVTRIERVDGGIDEVTLPLNPTNCEIFDALADSLPATFEQKPTNCLISDISREPTATFDEYATRAPEYDLFDRKHAGSIRNLVSYEGDVGYIYLPTDKNNPPQYLRVMQKHGRLYLNMTGLGGEKPEDVTTCEVLAVSTEMVDTRSFLALDLSYGGKRHKLVLPVPMDLDHGVNTELYYDLQALTKNETIQLNQIKDWERPDVKNFTYAPEMERAIVTTENQIEGTVKIDTQKRGEGAKRGQKFDELARDELSTYNLGGVTYHGLTQNVRIEGAPQLGPQQKISLYNDTAQTIPVDGGTAEQHLLATVTRQRTFTNPDGSQTTENQTVYAVLEREQRDADGTVTRGRTLLISADYMAEMQRHNPDFTITSGATVNADGFYEFPVQNVKITANGELLYGIQVAGREVAIAANARGSQIVTQEGGVQRRASLLNEGSPMNIGYVTRILDEAFTEGSNVTIEKQDGDNDLLIGSLLVQRVVLERRERGPAETVIEVGIPPERPKIRLYSAIIKQKSVKGESVEQAVNFLVDEKGQVYVYAKVGGKVPAWTKVDRARLAQHAVEKDGSHNPALVLASGKGTSEVTIPIDLDFTENQDLLNAVNGTQENPGFLHEALAVETREGSKSQKSFFYKADGEDSPKVHSTDAPPDGALPVYERTNQKTASVEFDTLANLQTSVRDGVAPEENLATPDKIEDPKKVEKPAEQEPDEWKPHPPMPNLRNCLIGGSVILALLSVFLPFLAIFAILLAGGAFVVEIQPWNMVGEARQKQIADEKKRIEDRHKQIERELQDVNKDFQEAKVALAKVEQQLASPNLKQSVRTRLIRQREQLQREILTQQKTAAALQVSARVQAQKNLVEHQKAVVATHERRMQQKIQEDYAKLRMQATEHDADEFGRATAAEQADFNDLSSRDVGTLSPDEIERLRRYRSRFRTIDAVEAQIAADQAADNEHLAQVQANLAKAEQEQAQAEAELAAAEADRDNPNPPASEWSTITSANAGMANYNIEGNPAYDQPLPGFTQNREIGERSNSRAPELDPFGRRRQTSRSSASRGEGGRESA